jgi:hypothetical protein
MGLSPRRIMPDMLRERCVNRISRKVIAMDRLAKAGGVQLKASAPSATITNRVSPRAILQSDQYMTRL